MSVDELTHQAKVLWEDGGKLVEQGDVGQGLAKCADAVIRAYGRGVDMNTKAGRRVIAVASKHCLDGDSFQLEATIVVGAFALGRQLLPEAERFFALATTMPGGWSCPLLSARFAVQVIRRLVMWSGAAAARAKNLFFLPA